MACGTLLAALSPAVAQDGGETDTGPIDLEAVPHDSVVGPFKIDDGSYAGAIAQSFRIRRDGGAIRLLLYRDGSGAASFDVVDEVMIGEWTMSDSGGLTDEANPGFIEADAIGSASGTLTGSFPYTFAGTFISDVTATVDPTAVGGAPVGSQSASDSDAADLTFEITETVQVCGQVQANWDESMRTFYIGLDFVPTVKTQLVVFPATGDEEIEQRVVDLVEYATFASTQVAGPDPAIEFMIDAVLQAEALMSDIGSYPDTCPLNPEFLRIVNQVVRDMINTLLDNWSTQEEFPRALTLRKLVEVGLRAGVIGSGSPDQIAADFLEAKITGLLQARFDEMMASPGLEEDELRQLVVVAEMFNYQLAATSNADVCIALGGC